jgi:hypothetical protein
MPAVSAAQRSLMGLAEHHPEQVQKRNRGVLRMSQGQLHDFASTKGLGPTHHDTAAPGGIAHQGTTVEGPEHGRARHEGATFRTGNMEGVKGFSHAGTTREGPHHRAAASTRRDAAVAVREEPKAFKHSGTSAPTYYRTHCAGDAKGEGWEGDGESRRPQIRRSRKHSGGTTDGFRHNLSHGQRIEGHHLGDEQHEPSGAFNLNEHTATAERAGATSHYQLPRSRRQNMGTGERGGEIGTMREGEPAHYRGEFRGKYEGGTPRTWSPTARIRGEQGQQGPRTGPGRQGRHAFKMATGPNEHAAPAQPGGR